VVGFVDANVKSNVVVVGTKTVDSMPHLGMSQYSNRVSGSSV